MPQGSKGGEGKGQGWKRPGPGLSQQREGGLHEAPNVNPTLALSWSQEISVLMSVLSSSGFVIIDESLHLPES